MTSTKRKFSMASKLLCSLNLARFQTFSYIEEQAENGTHGTRSTVLFDLKINNLI